MASALKDVLASLNKLIPSLPTSPSGAAALSSKGVVGALKQLERTLNVQNLINKNRAQKGSIAVTQLPDGSILYSDGTIGKVNKSGAYSASGYTVYKDGTFLKNNQSGIAQSLGSIVNNNLNTGNKIVRGIGIVKKSPTGVMETQLGIGGETSEPKHEFYSGLKSKASPQLLDKIRNFLNEHPRDSFSKVARETSKPVVAPTSRRVNTVLKNAYGSLFNEENPLNNNNIPIEKVSSQNVINQLSREGNL